ncbi:MAG: hypothetical protein LBN74_02305 [Prevotella sp.]|jgi:hypothetical protein|nr:hypothetical protein [Prevotella sp.]
MKYNIKYNDQIFEIDDLVLFRDQSPEFKDAYNTIQNGSVAKFDNAVAELTFGGRVVFTINNDDNV